MKILQFAFLIASSGFVAAGDALEDLMARIEATAAEGRGMNEAEQKLADELSTHGTAAADLLVPLLKSPDAEVRQLVGFCINELAAGCLLPRHLAPLAESCREERGWLPNAIADIGTDEAASFLAEEFRREPQIDAQIDYALIRMVPRSIGPLLREFKAAGEDETEFLGMVPRLWRKMETSAEPTVAALLEIALDPAADRFRRLVAIQSLGAIGPAAQPTFGRLNALAAAEGEQFAEAVQEAIANSRTGEAAEILLPLAIGEARTSGDLYQFRDIADMKGHAAPLGDRLADLLDDPNPSVRLGACRTLGYTTRLDLWPQLSRALKDPDWRVSFAACSSLAQLKAKGAAASLEALARTHWYPRVKHAALHARFRVLGEPSPEEHSRHVSMGEEENDFFFDFGSGDLHLDAMAPEKLGLTPLAERRWVRWEGAEESPAGFGKSHPRLFKAISESPDATSWGNVAYMIDLLERDGDTLVAFVAGEWVGGLFAVSAEGKPSTVLKENIHGMFSWDGRIVTLSGTNHMGLDDGAVHEVSKVNGEWKATYLHALPGCPIQGGLLPDGRLVANCSGGAVAIGKDGKFEYLGSGGSGD